MDVDEDDDFYAPDDTVKPTVQQQYEAAPGLEAEPKEEDEDLEEGEEEDEEGSDGSDSVQTNPGLGLNHC
jgi:pre-mRNA 3'-end-processing factor FIP1